jgi:hypothetical protein
MVLQTFLNQNCFCYKISPVSLIYQESIEYKILHTFRLKPLSLDSFFWMESLNCKHNSASKYHKGLHEKYLLALEMNLDDILTKTDQMTSVKQ